MKNWLYIFAVGFLLFSCSEEEPEMDGPVYDVTRDENLDLDQMAKRHIEAALEIPSTEKYTLEIFRKNLDADDFEDAVILVNRHQKAEDEAIAANNTAQRAETGLMGNYNYMFFFDGGVQKITRPINIPSSAVLPLKVRFEHIQSEGYYDILIEHRIRDAGYLNFFTVRNHAPALVFQWLIYDNLNKPNQVCNYIAFAEGSKSLAKDILVFPGKFNGPIPKERMGEMEAKIERDGDLIYRFFYDNSKGKYFTDAKVEMEQ